MGHCCLSLSLILQIFSDGPLARANKVRLGDDVVVCILDPCQELLCVLRILREQGIGDLLLRCLAKPLEQGDVPELIGTEDLQHLDRLIANVLDKVTHVAGHDADISGSVVKGSGSAFRCKDGHSGATLEEEGPLISRWVPVHLSNSTGLNEGVSCSDCLGDGEVLRVRNANLTTARDQGLLVKHSVGEVVLGLLDLLALGSFITD